MNNRSPYLISSVTYTDTDGRERTRIVLDVPGEQAEDFFRIWKEWNDKKNKP